MGNQKESWESKEKRLNTSLEKRYFWNILFETTKKIIKNKKTPSNKKIMFFKKKEGMKDERIWSGWSGMRFY